MSDAEKLKNAQNTFREAQDAKDARASIAAYFELERVVREIQRKVDADASR